jgi:HK97 family phage major capsid protein
MHSMNKDFRAYRAKLAALAVATAALCGPAFAGAVALTYEMRDGPDLSEITKAISQINEAFSEYKKTNDSKIEAVKKGLPTGDLDAKLAKMDEHIDALTEMKARLEKMETRMARPGNQGGAVGGQTESEESIAYRNALTSWMRNGQGEAEVRAAAKAVEAKMSPAEREQRATQVSTGVAGAGGYALPEIIERQILRIGLDVSPMREISTVRLVGSPDYKELVDLNGASFEWLGEGDTRNQTNTSDLQEIAPTFGMASAKPQATEESLNDLFFNVEDWVISSAGEAIGQGEGAAFISGNGTKKPTGFLAGPTPVTTGDSARAFGTLQYFASGQAAAMPTSADTFLDMIYGVRARYRNNARWVTNKSVLAQLRKYKDSTGQYLWQPSLSANQPQNFMGYAITEAEDMPAVAAGAFPLAFGDFKEGYLICDLVGMRMTRDEVTAPGFVKFYIRRRVGGKLRNTQAIKLLKIATS